MASLTDILLHHNLLDAASIQAAVKAAEQQKIALTTYLVKYNLINSHDLLYYTSQHFNLPIFDLKQYDYQQMASSTISPELINRYRVLPLQQDEHTLTLCVTDPSQQDAFSTINFYTGKNIKLALGDEILLEKILTTHCRPHIFLTRFLSEEKQSYDTEATEQDDEPIIEYVNHLITNAIEKQISDIHIEPFIQSCRIRFRRDGLLYEAACLPPQAALRVTTRLKIMANLNIAECRLPQDGRIPWRKEARIDIRINSIPTLHGEKLVLRLLNTQHAQLDLAALGLQASQLQQLRNMITKPQGLILVTGPTGSGKSVTLYSILHAINQMEINISSVEDPVEIEVHGINQININYKIGLDFPAALRMLLRQDPDVLMIGEIRDLETATIAMQAAQTGHLVLATLHTNSAPEALQRLQTMGLKPYQLSDAILLVIAQRLVRVLCSHCKKPTNDKLAYQAIGCEHCYQGYRGRTAVFAFNESLWESAQLKVKEGITSLAEIQRVIMDDAYHAPLQK